MSEQTAVPILYDWFKNNVGRFKSKKAQIEFRDSGAGSAYVRVDTQTHMTEIIVWDEIFRLNSEIINLDTDETTFPHTGDCESQADFEQQLEDYLTWLDESHPQEPED